MIADLREAVRRRSLWQRGDAVCAAVSGGCDSVALLHALHAIAAEEGIALSAVHVNHHLRGAESDADAAFVADLCERLGVPLTLCDVYVREERLQGESEEVCARRLRYRAFEEQIARGRRVATAHTLSDQAETVLFRLARGTGVKGLCGIPAEREGIIRPLLAVSREQTEAYCRENGLAYRTDSSNESDAYTRNYLRHRVLPPLREAFPGCEEAVGRLCEQMSELDAMLDRSADALLAAAREGDRLRLAPLREAEPPVLARALARFLEETTGVWPDAAHTNDLLAGLSADGRLQLDGGWQAIWDDTFRLIPPEGAGEGYEFPLAPGVWDTPLFHLTVYEEKNLPSVHNSFMFSVIDRDKITDEATLRPRRPGDRLRLPKRADKPLRRWMSETGLPPEQRDPWPVAADGEGVLALIGVGAAERAAPDENTKRFLIIKAEEKSCLKKT